jgi:class 3 adenylate cyclase/tetratricopeptide (TPR) repeat protein
MVRIANSKNSQKQEKGPKRCPSCQTENREEAKFCIDCGKKLEQWCPRCEKVLPATAKFCDECGYDLSRPPSLDLSCPKSYIPRLLADKILTARKTLEGERKQVTVLFADVANYTSMCEALDFEEVPKIMDGCFKLLLNEIHKHEGTVSQFTGDGIMAIFGAPLAHEDHAQRACYAALSIQRALGPYAQKVREEYSLDFKMRIGIHSGGVIITSIGDDLSLDFVALGDTTNLASRMETTASPGSILVSKDTYDITSSFFNFRPVGKLTIKGKGELIQAYELIGPGEVQTRIGVAVARGLAKFVGREHELVALKQCFERVLSGLGQVVGLMGEAGVGKSRLVWEFRKTLQEDRYTYLEGRCIHFGTAMAFLPIRDILRSYFGVAEGMEEPLVKERVLERMVRLDEVPPSFLPAVHEILSVTVEDESYLRLDPKQRRERIFEAIRHLLAEESRKKPMIMVVEDLHWIDKTSEEFLSHLIGSLAGTKILLILLYRSEYSHPWETKSFYNRLGLDQLPVPTRSELIESLFGGVEISKEVREFILGKAGGNPLFMEELTYALLQGGYIKKEGQGYELSKDPREIQVPNTIHGIIASRIDRLEDESRRTLQAASVIGRKFAFSILEPLVGFSRGLKSHLLELQGLELIHEKSPLPKLEYEFKHVLVQEVTYNSLLLRRRKEVHEQIGEIIEIQYKDRLEELYEMLAYHYSRSENREKAFKYLKLSGMKATQNSSLWEAFHFYREAVRILKQGLTSDEQQKKEQIEVYLLMASPMISLGFPEDSLELLQEGEKLSREIPATNSLIMFSSIIGLYYSVKGDTQTGAKYGEECLNTVEKTQQIDLIAPIAFDLCSNYAATGFFFKVVDLAPRILSLLEKDKKELESFDRGYNVYSALSAFYGLSLGYLGKFEEGELFCEKALHVALDTKNLYSLGLAEVLYGFLCGNKGEGRPAMQHFQKSIEYLEKGQIFVLLGTAWGGLGYGHYLLNDLETARTCMEKGFKLHSEAGISYNMPLHYWLLAMVYTEFGDLKRAQEYAEQAINVAQNNNELYYMGMAMILLGRILAKEGSNLSLGKEMILRGIKILDNLMIKIYWAVGYLWLGELYGYTHQGEEAVEALKTAESFFSETGMDYWKAKAKMLLSIPDGSK